MVLSVLLLPVYKIKYLSKHRGESPFKDLAAFTRPKKEQTRLPIKDKNEIYLAAVNGLILAFASIFSDLVAVTVGFSSRMDR
ncbi:hypothetical protein ROZALSC1DRAFT_27601 [Rozella allomycis CSF55]|uniref:Uncharacterized protein n=1 Tax=Rozella allomycis (strain CSF55) TaxID=988480 RepID=A0A075AQQ5_ROZAC|nr:hypothetical protein O9G_004137 [Rozella allomycis CSF55]RKP20949.1 hypothetical protein ROZALSC1DRAFT_27601 [Rozella allomycis CSF55]|eukprot:EPZ32563.1 hypothetical protein O9G_004137 [Rozella allomycis CSF55]